MAGLKEGHGIYRFASGAVYEGQFKADKREGQGTYRYASGRVKLGSFKAGADSGEGVTWSADGTEAWRLRDGEPVGVITLEEAKHMYGAVAKAPAALKAPQEIQGSRLESRASAPSALRRWIVFLLILICVGSMFRFLFDPPRASRSAAGARVPREVYYPHLLFTLT